MNGTCQTGWLFVGTQTPITQITQITQIKFWFLNVNMKYVYVLFGCQFHTILKREELFWEARTINISSHICLTHLKHRNRVLLGRTTWKWSPLNPPSTQSLSLCIFIIRWHMTWIINTAIALAVFRCTTASTGRHKPYMWESSCAQRILNHLLHEDISISQQSRHISSKEHAGWLGCTDIGSLPQGMQLGIPLFADLASAVDLT